MSASSLTDRIVPITADRLEWHFGQGPRARTGKGPYGGRTEVDPFPCYAHDLDLVGDTLAHVERIVDVAHKPTVYVLDREPLARTNGWANTDAIYYDEDEPPVGSPKWHGIIVLAGKRIPLHPAMTRYLVAHEYGHHVEYELLHRRGLPAHSDAVVEEYAKMRGAPAPAYYGGGTWHASPVELLANDFRVLVAEVETEFWPHPGFPRPEQDAAVRRWWEENL